MKKIVEAFSKMIDKDVITILPGVDNLLKALNESNFLIGLVTGNLEPVARNKMKKINLDHYFKVGGFGNEHINRTELVKIAIKKAQSNFNFIFSNNVYLFGDAPQDIKARNEAGVTTIGVTTGIYSKKQLENAAANFILKDFSDTEIILNKILK